MRSGTELSQFLRIFLPSLEQIFYLLFFQNFSSSTILEMNDEVTIIICQTSSICASKHCHNVLVMAVLSI